MEFLKSPKPKLCNQDPSKAPWKEHHLSSPTHAWNKRSFLRNFKKSCNFESVPHASRQFFHKI